MLPESSFHCSSLRLQIELISWAWTYIPMVATKFPPAPPFSCLNFSNGSFKESLHTMGFEIVGTWSIFTCNYKLLLSKHRMLYKPSYDYYIQQNQKKTQFHERAVFLPFCYHCFVLVYPADTYLPMYTAMPDLWALLLNSSSCRLLASLGLQAQPGIE